MYNLPQKLCHDQRRRVILIRDDYQMEISASMEVSGRLAILKWIAIYPDVLDTTCARNFGFQGTSVTI